MTSSAVGVVVPATARVIFQGADGMRFHCVTAFSRVLFLFQAEDGIRDHCVTGVQTCALPICSVCPGGITVGSAVNKVMLNPEFASALGNQTLAARKPQTQAQLDDFLAADGQIDRKSVV